MFLQSLSAKSTRVLFGTICLAVGSLIGLDAAPLLIPKDHHVVVRAAEAILHSDSARMMQVHQPIPFRQIQVLKNIKLNESRTKYTVKIAGLYSIFAAVNGTTNPNVLIDLGISVNGKTPMAFQGTAVTSLTGAFTAFTSASVYLKKGDKVAVVFTSASGPITVAVRDFQIFNINQTN